MSGLDLRRDEFFEDAGGFFGFNRQARAVRITGLRFSVQPRVRGLDRAGDFEKHAGSWKLRALAVDSRPLVDIAHALGAELPAEHRDVADQHDGLYAQARRLYGGGDGGFVPSDDQEVARDGFACGKESIKQAKCK